MSLIKEFSKGIWRENPVLVLALGMCPTLAVTSSITNGLGMGLATLFVLVGSNLVISAIRKLVPRKVRIPCYIVVIATFVTVADMLMSAYAPPKLNAALGIFIPLIVVNCIILGRAEAFASKHSVLYSVADGIGMGIGFTLGLVILAACREILGAGTITVWGSLKWQVHGADPILLMVLAPGGFIALGCLLGFMNHIQAKIAARQGKSFSPPPHLDCRHCVLCKWGE